MSEDNPTSSEPSIPRTADPRMLGEEPEHYASQGDLSRQLNEAEKPVAEYSTALHRALRRAEEALRDAQDEKLFASLPVPEERVTSLLTAYLINRGACEGMRRPTEAAGYQALRVLMGYPPIMELIEGAYRAGRLDQFKAHRDGSDG